MDSKVLIISKPVFNNIMPLVDFPKNKDIFNLNMSLESIMGEANVAAYILGKYNIPVSYTGITGNDESGNKFRKVLEENHVDIHFMETDFEGKTDVTYTIINTEKGGFSHIKINSMKNDLTKFKYDFIPSFIVFDDKDFSGANAALNNYPNVKSIFYGKNPNKDAINMCKRADYVVCNINFASKLTGLEIVLNKPKTIIALYQKLIDLFKGEWVITLGEYGVIYCNENNVKMIPALKTEVVDRDKAGSVFFGTFAYSIVSGFDIENAVRLANINASNSLNQIGAINGLMELEDLLKHKVNVQSSVASVDTQNSVATTQSISTEQPVEQLNANNVESVSVGNNVNVLTQEPVIHVNSQPANSVVVETLNTDKNE